MDYEVIRNKLRKGSEDLMQLSPIGAGTLLYLHLYVNTSSTVICSGSPDIQRQVLNGRYKDNPDLLEHDLVAGPEVEGILKKMGSHYPEQTQIAEFSKKSLPVVGAYNQLLIEYSKQK